MEYDILIETSHELGKNVGSCMENPKTNIVDTKEVLQRKEVKQIMLLFLKIEDIFNSTLMLSTHHSYT